MSMKKVASLKGKGKNGKKGKDGRTRKAVLMPLHRNLKLKLQWKFLVLVTVCLRLSLPCITQELTPRSTLGNQMMGPTPTLMTPSQMMLHKLTLVIMNGLTRQEADLRRGNAVGLQIVIRLSGTLSVRRTCTMRQEVDTHSAVERCHDLYIPDVGCDDSEYGSYFYASIDMPSVEG